ncbi:MAG TPA: hypothetical protein VHU17_08245 [Acidimicrobiales bacterium]|nr:hypothetical protein [Acidimicrobiales bacterium]
MGDFNRVQNDADLRAVSDSPDATPAAVHGPEQAAGAALMAIPAPLVTVDPSALAGATITVVDDGQRVAPLVAGLLQSHGANAQLVEPGGIPEMSDGIIHLGQLHSGTQPASDLFNEVYPVAKAGATTVVTVTGLGGTHGQDLRDADHTAACARTVEAADIAPPSGAGIGSLLGGLAQEIPGANVRAVDLDCFDDPVVLAGRIVAEALASGGPVAVGYHDDRRCTVVSTGEAWMTDNSEPHLNWGPVGASTARHLDPGLLLIS